MATLGYKALIRMKNKEKEKNQSETEWCSVVNVEQWAHVECLFCRDNEAVALINYCVCHTVIGMQSLKKFESTCEVVHF